jgi:beta-glucosidase
MSGDDLPRRFPAGFLWGAATSAYQIEGGAAAEGRGPSIWDTFSARPGVIRDGSNGAVAADHFDRSRDDVQLMADLGLQMYRFSVAWPRIQPKGRGPVNQKGLDFYRRLVDELLERGIQPNLTLYHWDLPQALQDAGGWAARETAYRFADYADIVYRQLHDRVGWWSTINEPWCVAFLGHAAGVHAPGIQDPRQAVRAIHHLLLAHGLAVSRMRGIDPQPRHGIVLNLAPVRTSVICPVTSLVKGVRLTDGYRNRVWLEPLLQGRYPDEMVDLMARFGGLPVKAGDLKVIGTPIDWMGINYYHDIVLEEEALDDDGAANVHPGVTRVRETAPTGDRTDMSWPITPDGLRSLLVSLVRQYPNIPPMMITENGAAFADSMDPAGTVDDERRIRYVDAHLEALANAITEGVDVRGYLVWSLLDNFEWAEGYDQRFGIVHVDFETHVRTPKRSALWYRDNIERNGSSPSDPLVPSERIASGLMDPRSPTRRRVVGTRS